MPFPTPGDLSDPEIKTESLASPSLAGGFFTIESCGKHHSWHRIIPGTSIFKTNWHHQVQSVTSPSRVSWNPQVFCTFTLPEVILETFPASLLCESVLSIHRLHLPLRSFLHTSLLCWLHHPGSLGLLTSDELTPSWPWQEVRE